MARTASVNVRVDPQTKAHAEKVFKRLGISTSEAINIFLSQVELQKGLPFAVEIPNATTRRAIEDLKQRRNVKRFKTADELFKDQGI